MITQLISQVEPIPLHQPGTHQMWTDPYISKQLLEVHLNPDINLASRQAASIDATCQWITGQFDSVRGLELLDLGCGPGLYAERLSRSGFRVTGIDYSANSIAHARQSAMELKLDITYRQGSYLELELEENHYDVIILLYTDIGVLSPENRRLLLKKIRQALKPGGKFIFDVLHDRNIASQRTRPNWEIHQDGFWSPEPHLLLSDSRLYQDEKLILFQHQVITERGEHRLYRFWTQFFDEILLGQMLQDAGFNTIRHIHNLLHPFHEWDGENVLFTIAE